MGLKKQDASNLIGFSQFVDVDFYQRLSASNTLSLVGATELNHKIKTVSSTLELEQTAEHNDLLYQYAQNYILFSTSVTSDGVISVSQGNFIFLTQSVRNSVIARTAGNFLLNLDHNVHLSRPYNIEVGNSLAGQYEDIDIDELLDVNPYDPDAIADLIENSTGLRHYVEIKKKILNISVKSYLSFGQKAARTFVGIASNHIHLSQTFNIVEYEDILTLFRLYQNVVVNKVTPATSNLLFTQEVTSTGVIAKTLTSELELRNVVSYVIVDFCGYAPGIGDGTFDYVAPPDTAPSLVRRTTTILTWPYNTPTLTLELRNPIFDNIEQFEYNRINRRARGGNLDLFRDENWPKTKRLIMSFTVLSSTQKTKLLEFLQRSLGQEVGLLDFESRQWRGIILTPSSAFEQNIRQESPSCSGFSVNLEFEGETV